ncbi:MAG: ATP-binding protein [Bacteroidota bacterium]
MNSIRGRILLAFQALCLLVTPFVIFTYRSIIKINKAKDLKEHVALFNINRLKASNAFFQLLDKDIKTDAFYLEGTTKNLQRFEDFAQNAEKDIQQINTFNYTEDDLIKSKLANIQSELLNLSNATAMVIDLQTKRGFRDFGLEGEMRRHIHSLENAEGISLTENLMLRRREKDFFLRDDHHYAALLNKECDSLARRMSAEINAYDKSLKILKRYQGSFNAIVALEKEIGDGNTGLLNRANLSNARLDIEVNQLYALVDHRLQQLTRNIRTYILVFFGITLIFVVLFIVIFSGHISTPLKRLVTDMDDISEKNFEGQITVTPKININEIKRLTRTYNELVQKIRGQIANLNENNKELNSLNAKLRESEGELKEASRIKDKFFSIISHDLRGHTGNVLSLAKILDEDSALSEKEKNVFIKYLVDSSQNLQLLLDNLLNWAKGQMNDYTVAKRAFKVDGLIEGNIDLFADNAFRKGVTLNYKSKQNPRVYADKDMVDFVLRNLLSNALKFTNEGDSVVVDVQKKKQFLQISVSDTGVGMSKKQLSKLLGSKNEGYTTKGTQNEVGTGLGLSICKDFIEKNGGELTVTSKVDSGSIFTFTLPTSLTRESIQS